MLKKIIQTFSQIFPLLSSLEKEKLLSFGEGLAFKVNEAEKARQEPKEQNKSEPEMAAAN